MWTEIVTSLIGPISNLIDDAYTTDEERLAKQNELKRILVSAEHEAQRIEKEFETEITQRHRADMISDSWLSKNIRPLVLVFLSVVFATITLIDGASIGFTVKEAYISVYETLLVVAFGFFFGGRSIEKTTKIFKGSHGKQNNC